MLQVASIFSQLLQQFPRNIFNKIVFEEKAERHAKGFRCWDQFVAMLFCHIAQADSLREICNGLRSCTGKLVHIGVKNAPKRSTLALLMNTEPLLCMSAYFIRHLIVFV